MAASPRCARLGETAERKLETADDVASLRITASRTSIAAGRWRTMNRTIPPSLLLRADEVIE